MAIKKTIDSLPKSPVYTEDRPAVEMKLSIITYDSHSVEMKNLSSVDELLQYKKNKKRITWINISGLKNVDSIKRLGELFNIHPLTIEDILLTEQQPKMELFDDYRFLSVKTIKQEKRFHHQQKKKKKSNAFWGDKEKPQEDDIDKFLIDQVSIITMKNVLITFQEISTGLFNNVRKRIFDNVGEVRKMGTDYLLYALIDAVVDEYFLALNHLEDDIENLEDRATKTSDATFIEEIQDTKKYLLQIRRAILPLKDNVGIITRRDRFFQTGELKPFLQDLNENLNNALGLVDNHREWLSNIMDVNLSILSFQLNKIMKVMTMISAIFIPLGFIAGVYGMNFQFMPELTYRYAYPIVLSSMGLIALTMVAAFKIQRWF